LKSRAQLFTEEFEKRTGQQLKTRAKGILSELIEKEVADLQAEVERLRSFLDDAIDSDYQCHWERPWREVFKEWKAERQEGEG
jgi:hypothetical protein